MALIWVLERGENWLPSHLEINRNFCQVFIPAGFNFHLSMNIRIINHSAHPLPAYETAHAAGMDLRANLNSPVVFETPERTLVPTGLFIELPVGFEAQVRPSRSGLAAKKGITVLNSLELLTRITEEKKSYSRKSQQWRICDRKRRTCCTTGNSQTWTHSLGAGFELGRDRTWQEDLVLREESKRTGFFFF